MRDGSRHGEGYLSRHIWELQAQNVGHDVSAAFVLSCTCALTLSVAYSEWHATSSALVVEMMLQICIAWLALIVCRASQWNTMSSCNLKIFV